MIRGAGMPTNKEIIIKKALEILDANPKGIRYSELVDHIAQAVPDIPRNTVHGNVWNLDVVRPAQVYKPARGVWKLTKYRELADTTEEVVIPTPSLEVTLKEEQFYQPFADWITSELEECTKAIALGGNRFKDKWGTPDVIGIREPRKSDIIKPATEIISAELKIDRAGLIVAFGQACAYKLFSHKSYIVVPSQSQEEDIARLDVLCRTLGIGLILFDADKPENPQFQIRVRASRQEPDMFYVNKFMKVLEDELFS
jgi:hypothetical protein